VTPSDPSKIAILNLFVILNLFQDPFRRRLSYMQTERDSCVYILASKPYGTIYIGVTSDLIARL